MNHSDIDDPLLTAYALGELPAAERANVEARLATDAEARQFVEETRAFAERLAGSLKTAPAPDLTPEQKAAILAEAQVAPPSRGKVIPFLKWAIPLSAAAAITAACVVALRQPPLPTFSKQLAANSTIAPPIAAQTPAPALRPETSVALTANAIDQLLSKGTKDGALAANDRDQKFEGRIDYGAPVDSTAAKALPPVGEDDLEMAKVARPGIAASGYITKSRAAADASTDLDQITPSTLASPEPNLPSQATTRPMNGRGGAVAGYAGTMREEPAPSRKQIQLQLDAPGTPGLPQTGEGNTEAYDRISDNEFLAARQTPLSTFSIDVDTASFTNVRRFLEGGNLPPKDAVRIEELLNYFPYDYAPPQGEDPFSVNVEVAPAPWNGRHLLAKIGLKGRVIAPDKRPATNLVFLLDVSGSMDEPNKLPLVRKSMKMLVERLNPEDRVAIIVYAGASGMALPSTPASKRREIEQAIDTLRADGSTNGAAGIELAYDVAKANFIEGGANRVVLCTDGDFNVGVTNQGDLLRLIETKAKSKVFLTVLGFGMGNYKDSTLEKLADKGNGNYGYIDDEREAKKMLVDGLSGTLVTIAKDVKVQVEFNPAQVGSYRLIGYENRLLKAEDFNNDKKDAGEIGAGHTVTALYELAPVGEEQHLPEVDALKYQQQPPTAQPQDKSTPPPSSNELMTVKLRYKQPEGDVSKLIEQVVTGASDPWVDSKKDGTRSISKDFQFAAAVAEFGMLLRESPFKGEASWKSAADLAENGLGADPQGYRHEFLKLIEQARKLAEPATPAKARAGE